MANMLKFLLLGFIMLVVSAQDIVTPCKGKDDCCDGILCGINEGDCDSHENCAGHLRCGVDNCDGPGFDSTDDCCWDDPLFPPPSPAEDLEKCKIAKDLVKKIAQAAVAQGCDLPEGRPESISLNECSKISCSADLIGKSFTCNNQNKEKTCKELLSLLDAMVQKRKNQCSQLLRTTTTCLFNPEYDYNDEGEDCPEDTMYCSEDDDDYYDDEYIYGTCFQCLEDSNCPSEEPRCSEEDECVECRYNTNYAFNDEEEDCPDDKEWCSEDEVCLECLDSTDCPDQLPHCSGGECFECLDNTHCTDAACCANTCDVPLYGNNCTSNSLDCFSGNSCGWCFEGSRGWGCMSNCPTATQVGASSVLRNSWTSGLGQCIVSDVLTAYTVGTGIYACATDTKVITTYDQTSTTGTSSALQTWLTYAIGALPSDTTTCILTSCPLNGLTSEDGETTVTCDACFSNFPNNMNGLCNSPVKSCATTNSALANACASSSLNDLGTCLSNANPDQSANFVGTGGTGIDWTTVTSAVSE